MQSGRHSQAAFPTIPVARKLPYQQIMRLTLSSLAVALIVAVASVCSAQPAATNQTRDTADFTVQVWGYIVADFSARVRDYAKLRSELEKGLPPLTVTDDPTELRSAVRALAKRIRVARAGAKQGDMFTPTVSVEFRKVLILEMDANTWAAIMDDNPGQFSSRINDTYPEDKPLSTVPSNILTVLPRLPDDIQYRFLGRHLILLDTRANVILDRIPFAIQSPDCVDLPCHR
jgi:hypothetical protein